MKIFGDYSIPRKKFSPIERMLAPLFELIAFTPLVFFVMPYSLLIFLLDLTLIMISSPHLLFFNPLFSGKAPGILIVVYSQKFPFNNSFRISGQPGATPNPIFPILLHGGIREKSKLKHYHEIIHCINIACRNKN